MGTTPVDFSWCLHALKDGRHMRRRTWAEGAFLMKGHNPAAQFYVTSPFIVALAHEATPLFPPKLRVARHGDHATLFVIGNGNEAHEWSPSVADLLANDWHEVEI